MKQMVSAGEADALVAERVWRELERALGETQPRAAIEVLRDCGALKVLLPEVDALFGVPQPPQHHPEVDTGEHLLLALIDDEDAAAVMAACGVDLAELGEVVKQYLDQEYQSLKTEDGADPQPTAGFQRVIQRAILHVQSSGKDTVTGANVLVALFSERDSYAVYFLQQQDMSRLDAVSYISHGIVKDARCIRDLNVAALGFSKIDTIDAHAKAGDEFK